MNRQLSPWPNSPSSTGEPRGFYGDPLNPIPNKSKDENEATPSATSEDDELWEEAIEVINPGCIYDVRKMLVNHLKQHFTISRRPKE